MLKSLWPLWQDAMSRNPTKEFLVMAFESRSLCLGTPATGSYPEPVKSSSQLYNVFLKTDPHDFATVS